MEFVKSNVGAEVVGIVTDNASNMENMREKILDATVFTYGCQTGVFPVKFLPGKKTLLSSTHFESDSKGSVGR